jgi:TPR repeat protein
VRALAVFLASSLSLAACASPAAYAAIPLTPGAADPELQSLAHRARRGDKPAQLELGLRYEEGLGLPVDLGRAARLYARAAADSGGVRWIYSPPVGSQKQGQAIAVNGGPPIAGLEAAKQRLRALRKRLGR